MCWSVSVTGECIAPTVCLLKEFLKKTTIVSDLINRKYKVEEYLKRETH